MFKLVQYELIKVIQKKSLIAFFVILSIVNVGIFAYAQNYDSSCYPLAYQKLQNQLTNVPHEKRYEFMKAQYEKYDAFYVLEQLSHLRMNQEDNQYMIDEILDKYPSIEEKYSSLYQDNHNPFYTQNLESEVVFLSDIMKEFQTLHDYPLYIQNIKEKAATISSISIFQKDNSFEEKNIQKTANDYANLFNTSITYETEKGICEALSFPMTSVILMLAMLVLSLMMVIDEKEKKLFSIIKITSLGQSSTIIAKCIVMVIIIGVMTTVLITSQLIYASFLYGIGDLSRSVQSLASYINCPFSLTVQQFICIFILIKWLSASVIGLLMILMAVLFNNKILTILGVIIVLIIEYIFFMFIPPLSPFYLLKYLNLVSILQTDSFFQIYRNVNVFNHLISLQSLTFIVVIILFSLLLILNIVVYHLKKDMSIKNNTFKILRFSHSPCLSLIGQELWKTMIMQKVFIICIACICVQYYQYQHISIYLDNDTMIYQKYMDELAGPLTLEKERWILLQQENYDHLHDQLQQITNKEKDNLITTLQAQQMRNSLEQELIGEEAFQKVMEQYHGIQENSQKQFVFEIPYQQYFIETTWTFMPVLFICLCLIIGVSYMLTYEYQNQMQIVTQATFKGNHFILGIKILLSFLIGGLIFSIVMLFPFVLMQKTYGFSSLFASIISIQELSLLPSWLSLFMAGLISILLKIFAIICMIMGIHAIGVKVRHYLLTVFISVGLFFVPLLLSYGGYHLLDSMSLYPLLFNGQFVFTSQGFMQLLFSFIGYSLVFIASVKYVFYKYKG